MIPKLNRTFLRNLIGTLAVLILLGGLLALRWRVWFGNLPELAYSTPDSITRLTVVPGERLSRDVTISWRAGSFLRDSYAEVSQLKDSTDSVYTRPVRIKAIPRFVVSRGGVDVYYHVPCKDLRPEGKYKVVVNTVGAPNKDSVVVHMPTESKPLNFLYLGDIQDVSEKDARERMTYINDLIEKEDFTIQVGDFIERPMNKYWNLVYATCDAMLRKQFLSTPGNHEVIKGIFKKIDPRWRAQFNFPLNGPLSQLGLSYYVDHPYCRFISLNSNNVDMPWQLYSQLKWLENTLKTATQPFIIVYMHHAVKPVRTTRTHPIMFNLIRPLLEKYHVDLVFQGHDHSYARTTHPDEDEKPDLTPPVYIISAFSAKYYQNGFSRVFDRMGSGIAFYSKLKMTGTQIDFQTFTYDGRLTDAFSIIRKKRNPLQPRDDIDDAIFVDKSEGLPEYLQYDQFGDSEKAKMQRAAYEEAVRKRISKRK